MMRLNDVCRIERHRDAGDFDRSPAETQVVAREVHAAIIPKSGNESIVGDQMVALYTHEIWMRYRPDVDEGCRVIGPLGDYAETYDVMAKAIVRNRKRFLKLECRRHNV